ncbi:hypothetical protein HYY71_03005 [Candidatus Woesearchaeota archaeon]|nr:hypothetical protein [Candidatus Woesearchaeota archaeon]
MNKSKAIERIELELLSTLLDYAVPFIGKKIGIKNPQKKQKTDNLENVVNKPKISYKDVQELESLLLKNLSENVKARKSVGIGKNDILYNLKLTRTKNKSKSGRYSLSIKYEENQHEDKLKISISKNEKEVYSAERANKKDAKDNVVPYSIRLLYEDEYGEERLSITYRQQLKGYMKKHIEDKEDMSNRVPLKWLNILPETMMGGVLGFTYLGENFMGRRADLVGKTARMVDIHESIHTPDEYETRVLTSWIMEKARSKYVK